jgi:hypothetical protein
MENNWVELLRQHGDPFEKAGVELGLASKFPKYAEFWGRFVQPNRDPQDFSKLHSGVAPDIQKVFNHHYSVFYQLVLAYRQLAEFPHHLIDIGDIFYHLGTAVDMVQRTFISVLVVKEGSLAGNVDWSKQRTISELFFKRIDIQNDLKDAITHIKKYRNVLTHEPSPLKLMVDGIEMLPKDKEHLKTYNGANWSSVIKNLQPSDFSSSLEIARGLTDTFVAAINNRWSGLITDMEQQITSKSQTSHTFYQGEGTSLPITSIPLADDLHKYTGGSAIYSINKGESVKPSGYKFLDDNGDPSL